MFFETNDPNKLIESILRKPKRRKSDFFLYENYSLLDRKKIVMKYTTVFQDRIEGCLLVDKLLATQVWYELKERVQSAVFRFRKVVKSYLTLLEFSACRNLWKTH